MTESVAIVGAGIAGLTAAHRLKQAGFRVVIFEALARPGGRMYSVRRGPYIFDLGTIGLLGGSPILEELVRAGRLEGQFGLADPLVAGIVRDGVARCIDSAHPIRDFLSTDLFSFGTKLGLTKMVLDVVRRRKLFNCANAIGLGPLDNETVAQYAERRLGREAADYLCAPLVRAIWMGDAHCNSVVQLLWTLSQMAFPMYTLSDGNGSLSMALAAAHDVRYSHTVTGIDNGNRVTLNWDANGVSGSGDFDACICAVPPPLALRITSGLNEVQRRFFEAARYTSMLAVHFGLTRRPRNRETVLMFPECEFDDIAAVYVNHNKAPGRAPDGKGSLSAYFTENWSQRHLDVPDDDLVTLACERLRPHYRGFESDIEDVFVQRWPIFALAAVPGIYRLMDDYQHWLVANPRSRLQFAGDFMPNSGINQAMTSGANAAMRIAELFR